MAEMGEFELEEGGEGEEGGPSMQDVSDELYADEEREEESSDDDSRNEEESEVDDEVETPAEGQRKRKLKAAVWSTAAKKVDGKARCNICLQFFACTRGNTSNITTHVKNKHAGSIECKNMLAMEKKITDEKRRLERMKPKQPSILNFITAKKPLTNRESEEMTSAMEDWLVATNTSFVMIENPSFRKMMFTFHSG
jgi:hypothetical protein